MKEFFTRLATTVVLAVIIFLAVKYLPDEFFTLLVLLISAGILFEIIRLTGAPLVFFWFGLIGGTILYSTLLFPIPLQLAIVIILVLYTTFILLYINRQEKLADFVRLFGLLFSSLLFVFFPLSFLVKIRFEYSPAHLFFLIFIIAIGDSWAYFIGVKFGTIKIYPVASPKKSLQGLIAALTGAAAFAYPGLMLFGLKTPILTAIFSAVAVELCSQIADPVESLYKRAANKKDSSGLLPGHGGIFDRLDSYLLCAPVFYYLLNFFWK